MPQKKRAPQRAVLLWIPGLHKPKYAPSKSDKPNHSDVMSLESVFGWVWVGGWVGAWGGGGCGCGCVSLWVRVWVGGCSTSPKPTKGSLLSPIAKTTRTIVITGTHWTATKRTKRSVAMSRAPRCGHHVVTPVFQRHKLDKS